MDHRLELAVTKVLPGVRADLESLVRIPSVSADPAAAGEVRRSAELTARLFGEAGMPEVAVLDDVPGMRPAVLARYPPPPGMPTVLLYAHHDVQPAGAVRDWTTPPFEPVERDGRLYGRGTADDKAGIAAHLAAIRAFGGRPPVGVTVFVEGEEEIGSPTLAAFLERHRAELAADAIVLADGDNFATGVPAFTTTLRGIASCTVEVGALRRPVHSGSYGGAAPDALTALCRLLSTLHDDRGEVAVAGLRRGTIAGISYPVDRFRAEAGLLDGVGLVGGGTLAERLWAKPAVTVLGIDAPATCSAPNALQATARAKVGVRVAPGDDAASAAAALAGHLREHAPWGVRVTVTGGETGQPHVIDASGPVYRAARESWQAAYGTEVAEIGGGGAIPFVADFARAFPAATILVTSPGGDPLANPHTVDENLHLGDFARACLAETMFLARCARLDI